MNNLMLQHRSSNELNDFLIKNGFNPEVNSHHYEESGVYIEIVLGDMYKCTVCSSIEGRRYKNTFQTLSSDLFESHLYQVARTNHLKWQLCERVYTHGAA